MANTPFRGTGGGLARIDRLGWAVAAGALALAALGGARQVAGGKLKRSQVSNSVAAPGLAAVVERGRGRQAASVHEIPVAGWKDIARRTYREFQEDNILLISAGVTFYTLLAFFPGLAAFVALYGLAADVHDARVQIQSMSTVLPHEVITFIGDQMLRAASAKSQGLSLALVGGLALSIWSANGAIKAMILGLNIAYEEEEKRSFLIRTGISLAFTLGFLLLAALLAATSVSVAAAAAWFGPAGAVLAAWLRWPILALGVVAAVTVLYRYGPSRDRAKWRWVSWGAAGVTVVWVAASIGFSFYLDRFAHYDATYGPLGAAIAFMMWTYLSAVILLCGAEFNAEAEHQTFKDTTSGPSKPLGLRGAAMADSIGAAQG